MSHIINYRLNQFSWAIAALLFLPLLFTKGMFYDGLSYASIARNMNDGVGTFWIPSYTPSIFPEFYKHPPFSFGLHRIFYHLFGDQPWVDRIYPYTMYGLSVLMLRRIWVLFVPAGHRAWIPQLLWTLTPTVIWVHRNNMLEAPLAAAVLCVVWLLFEGTMKKNYIWSLLAGIVFFFSLGIKGPVSLFPLMTLPIMATLYPERRRAALYSMIIMIVVFSAIFAYFYVNQPAYENFFSSYLTKGLLPILFGNQEYVGGTLKSIIEILKQLALPILVTIIFRMRKKEAYTLQRGSVFFFLLALCGTLPFLLMDRQQHYYFMPSMAFWMMGFAIHLAQHEYPWSIQRKKWVKVLSLSNLCSWVMAIGLSIYFSKSPSRDKHIIHGLEAIDNSYKPIAIKVDDLSENWRLAAIAERYTDYYFTENDAVYYISNMPGEVAGYEFVENYAQTDIYLYKKSR